MKLLSTLIILFLMGWALKGCTFARSASEIPGVEFFSGTVESLSCVDLGKKKRRIVYKILLVGGKEIEIRGHGDCKRNFYFSKGKLFEYYHVGSQTVEAKISRKNLVSFEEGKFDLNFSHFSIFMLLSPLLVVIHLSKLKKVFSDFREE